MAKKGITKRSENYSKWYLEVIENADLVENSNVRGCMVFKPYGYAIWENFQKELDRMFKETGHRNAYFPLFIPKSLLAREEEHIEGFAKECAVVTHYRLKSDKKKGVVVDPDAKLEEELIVRPTSETIIYDTYSRWIKSWRDLPLLLNQWSNVVRWEMRTRPFLRTAEFLWQEGHTAHATYEEAEEESRKMLGVYCDFARNFIAVPGIIGTKSKSETFPGAIATYTLESMMQDKKALQACTSHNLGQNFSKGFDIKFTDKDGEEKHVWQTSWGLSTRMMGALIMTHSDDTGLVVPPKIAPIKVVIVPIFKSAEEEKSVRKELEKILKALDEYKLEIEVDDRDHVTPGHKFNEWEKKGVPLRMEIGPKDVEKSQVVLVRRDTGEKSFEKIADIKNKIEKILDVIQVNLLGRAESLLNENTHEVNNYDDFKGVIEEGGFVLAHWDGSEETEKKIQEETGATIRCIPFDSKKESGKCVYSGKKSEKRVLFAKAY